MSKLTLSFFVDGEIRRHKCYETNQSDDVERYIDDVCYSTSAGLATGFQKSDENGKVGRSNDPWDGDKTVNLETIKFMI